MADLSQVRDIERASLRAWPALEQLDDEGWLVRLSEGYTKRANSVTVLHSCGEGMAARVTRCEERYRGRGLPPIFRLVDPLVPDGLDAHLAGRGYALVDPTLVLSAPLAELTLPTPPHSLHATDDIDCWLHAYQAVSGSELAQATHGRILAAIEGRVLLAIVQRESEPVACALAVAEGDHVGLFDLAVAPAWRRRGLGRALMIGLLRSGLCVTSGRCVHGGRDAGATQAYLQVVEANAPARALYEGLGFRELYRYWYRVGSVESVAR